MARARHAALAALALTVGLVGCVGVIEPMDPGPGGGGDGSGGGGSSAGGAGGGALHSTAAGGASCDLGIDVRHEIFIERCGACHGSTSPSAGLDLVTKGVVARLRGRPARTCGGKPLVAPDGSGGVLLERAREGGGSCGGGRPMPPSGPTLDEYEIGCLAAFIARP